MPSFSDNSPGVTAGLKLVPSGQKELNPTEPSARFSLSSKVDRLKGYQVLTCAT